MATNTSQVASFYDHHHHIEHARLKENPIEYAVTWTVIKQTVGKLTSKSSKTLHVLDIGGGTGIYAVQLARLGHQVTLVDISGHVLNIATQHAKDNDVELAQIIAADARTICDNTDVFKESHYDIILCLGPFYHLLHEEERKKLLRDLITMTKPEGYIFAAFVTMFAHLRDVAKKDPGRLLRKAHFYAEYLKTGQYTKTLPMHHTYAAQIRKLFREVKDELVIERFVGTESFLTGRMSVELQGLSDKEFEPWAEITMKFAEDPEAAGSADHILVAAKKF